MNKNSNNLINCDSCDYCYYCDYCDSCDSCDSCDYCYYCDSCDSCNYCNSCNYSQDLRMTEYNTFCYPEKYNDENSFQQPRYRVFNTKVEKERYFLLLEEITEILKDFKLELNKNSWEKEWEKVSTEQWKQLMELAKQVRGDDFREGFEFISGIEIKLDNYAYDKIRNILGKIINGKIIQ